MTVKGKILTVLLMVFILAHHGTALILKADIKKGKAEKSVGKTDRVLREKGSLVLLLNSQKNSRSLEEHSFQSLMLIALITFLLIEAPSWALLLIGGTFLLKLVTKMIDGKGEEGERRLSLAHKSIKSFKRKLVSTQANKEIVDEEKNLVRFIKKNKINLHVKNKKRALYNIVHRYMRVRYKVKGKGFERRLRKIVNLIYTKKKQIMDSITKALN
jgi:hypothetical protein